MKRPIILALSALLLVCACGKESKEDKTVVPTTPQLSSEDVITEATQRIIDAVNANNNQKLEDLLKNGDKANLDVTLPTGDTLLTQALRSGSTLIAKTLITGGADFNKKNRNGETPLMIVAIKGHLDFLKNDLLPYRKDLKFNLQDNNGDTALHHAILNGHELIAHALLDENVEVRITNAQMKNSEVIAKEMNMFPVLTRIIKIIDSQRGRADRETILKYIREGKTADLAAALDFDPAIVIDYADLHLLYVAINETVSTISAEGIVNTILLKQANPNGYAKSKKVPLIAAVKMKRSNIVNTLLEYKADPNLQDDTGASALIHAVQANNPEYVEKLMQNNALKKYKVTVNEKQKKFNACSVARDIRDNLKTKEEKDKNSTIKKHLDCGLRFLPFI